MKTLADKLTYLSKRPFWAMLRTEVEAVFARIIEETKTVTSETDVYEKFSEYAAQASAWAVSHQVTKALADKFQALTPTGTKTAVIQIIGPLSLDNDVLWYGGTTYGSIQDGISQALADPNVKDIILLVDSPGGDVVGWPETCDAVYNAGQKKPVTAMITGMAASAAYGLVSQASHIMLTPSGSVGSVGVITMHTDISKLLEDMGVKITAVYAGKHKTEWSPFAPLTEEDQAAAQSEVDGLYQNFLATIMRGRASRATKDGVESNFGNGRMLTATDAVAAGMVDMIANIRDEFQARKMKLKSAAQIRIREVETL